jgi:hypothetical protein
MIDLAGTVMVIRYFAGWADKVSGKSLEVILSFVGAYKMRSICRLRGPKTPSCTPDTNRSE